MIKIVTTKAWKALLARVDSLEREVATLRSDADDFSRSRRSEQHKDVQRTVRIKCLENDVKELKKTKNKTKNK